MCKKVLIENIVFCQGDDYIESMDDMSDSDLVNYLLEWWYPGEHDTNWYDARGINTPFLGYEYKLDSDVFLLSHNRRMGYAGISRVLEYSE